LNDVEAMAHGVLKLQPEETELLNGQPQQNGTKVLVAPGTGLGEAIIYWDGNRFHPMPTEGGHASFAPNSDIEIDLLRYIRTSFLHVNVERVLSGDGLHTIYQFLRDTKKNEPTWFAELIPTGDPPTLIVEAALNGKPDICVQTLDLFLSIFGAEAGNLALKTLALGGVYLGGGIVPYITQALKGERFVQSFIAKGRYKRLLSSLPVHAILHDQAGLLGAASVAARMARTL
jgi:glucokinase